MCNLEIEEFCDYLKFELNLSNNTIANYRYDLIHFYQKTKIKSKQQINEQILIDYLINDLKNIKIVSMNRKKSSLKKYFKFLLKENSIDENLLDMFSTNKIPEKIPNTLTIEQVEKILKNLPVKTKFNRRNYLAILILYYTGIRVTELINITIDKINFIDQTMIITGKGNKERIVILPEFLLNYIKDYLKNDYRDFDNNKTNYLFINYQGKKISRQSIWKEVNQNIKLIISDIKISPHVFRHSYATHMIEAGANIRDVQQILGHVNLVTTQIYTKISDELLKKQYLKYNLRANLSKEIK